MADSKPDATSEINENTTSPQVLQTPTPPGDMEAEVAKNSNNIEIMNTRMDKNFEHLQKSNDDMGVKFSSMMDMFQQFVVQTQAPITSESQEQSENQPKSQDIRKQDAQTKAAKATLGNFQTPYEGGTQEQYFQTALRDSGGQQQAFTRMSQENSKSPPQGDGDDTFLDIPEDEHHDPETAAHIRRMSGVGADGAKRVVWRLQKEFLLKEKQKAAADTKVDQHLANPDSVTTEDGIKFLNAQRALNQPEPQTHLEFMTQNGGILKNLNPAEIFNWVELSMIFAKQSKRQEVEFELNWHQSINCPGIVKTLEAFNFYRAKATSTQKYREGRIFNSFHGMATSENAIAPGFELKYNTKLAQLKVQPFAMLLRLYATPPTFSEYQKTYCQVVEKKMENLKLDVKALPMTNEQNILKHWNQLQSFTNILRETQTELLEATADAKRDHPDDRDYQTGVNPVWIGKTGLRTMMKNIVTQIGPKYMVTWLDRREMDNEKSRAQKYLPKGIVLTSDLPTPEKIRGSSQSYLQELSLWNEDLSKLYQVAEVADNYRHKHRLDVPTPFVFGADKSKPSLSELESHHHEMERAQLQEIDEEENWLCSVCVMDGQRGSGNLYDHKAPKLLPGLDRNDKNYCYHDILGIPCTKPGCPGEGNKDPMDGWKNARGLRAQNIENSEKSTARGIVIDRSMDRFERALRAAGRTFPSSRAVPIRSESTDKPLRDGSKPRTPPPAPSSSAPNSQRRSSQPPRDAKILKKHQYSSKLNEMTDEEFEAMVSAMVQNDRFTKLFVIDGNASEDPKTQRFFEPET
jgi:hypothetical protein